MSDAPLKSYEFRREREPAWRELETPAREGREVRRAPPLRGRPRAAPRAPPRGALEPLRRARHLARPQRGRLPRGPLRRAPTAWSTPRDGPSSRPWAPSSACASPRAVRAHAGPLLLAVLATLLGTGAGWALCAADSERYYAFVPVRARGRARPRRHDRVPPRHASTATSTARAPSPSSRRSCSRTTPRSGSSASRSASSPASRPSSCSSRTGSCSAPSPGSTTRAACPSTSGAGCSRTASRSSRPSCSAAARGSSSRATSSSRVVSAGSRAWPSTAARRASS